MTINDRLLDAANARVEGWAVLAPDGAVIIPTTSGTAVLSWRGVDEPHESVLDAVDAAFAKGIPLDRVRVERFPSLPVVLTVSPALRS